jgi:hypothetical protein
MKTDSAPAVIGSKKCQMFTGAFLIESAEQQQDCCAADSTAHWIYGICLYRINSSISSISPAANFLLSKIYNFPLKVHHISISVF